MKKTVPLKKDLEFKGNLAEITSIALDHDLNLEGRSVRGNLTISGTYKINDISVNTEDFNYEIPVNIEVGERYILDELKIYVDDFYYEIINNSVLSVNIEIGLDNLKEKEVVINPIKYDPEKVEKVFKEEDRQETKEIKETKETKEVSTRISADDVKTLFDKFDDSSETYSTYKVCIVKESETVESIVLKYGITRDVLEQYNDLSDLKIGDKLIIPTIFNEAS